MSAPLVLVVTRHQAFAASVRRQLCRLDAVVDVLSPDHLSGMCRLQNRLHEVAFVDFAAHGPDGERLFRTVGAALKDCQVVLICTEDESREAADAARFWEVFDYVLTESVTDPNRIPLLVERARSHCLPDLSEIQSQEKRQYRRILETLADLRAILKSGVDNPVVRLIDRWRADRSVPPSDDGSLAAAYQHQLVDVLCGRLTRLERDFRLSGDQQTPARYGLSAPRILLVEDSPICADITQNILESAGLEVTVAPTAEAAQRVLERDPPSLILMDVHLGSVNGLDLVKSMRHGGKCPDVPVIVCSADRMAETVRFAARLNVQGYLIKPYVPNELLAKVRGVLANSALKILVERPEHSPMAAHAISGQRKP